MRYELVVFDNDGVLVDSEPISNRILADHLTELGFPTTFEDSVRDYMGCALHSVHERVAQRWGRALPDGFDDAFHARVFAAFEERLRPVAGIEAVLEKLSADGVPFCVASSGSHARIGTALRTTGLERFFDAGRVFSADDVGRGKPAPDLFLHAAREMGVAAPGCAVVEDSPLGVRAAVAAGMDVYGFTAMTPAARLPGATAVFADHADLPGLLA